MQESEIAEGMGPDRPGPWAKAGLLAGLYTTQTLGLAFVTTAVPVILRKSGVGLGAISVVFALGIIWPFKFLWAPIIDRFGPRRLGHYRGWIILLQFLMSLSTVCAAFFSIQDQLPVLAVLLALISFFSATQDIAADGLSVNILAPDERARGCSIQSAGNMLGFLIGGGLMLLVYPSLGWKGSLLTLAVAMALPYLSILRFREPAFKSGEGDGRASFAALVRFFKRPGILHWIAILLVFRINGQITYWLLNTFMVDMGWSLEHIGFALNIFGLMLGMLGSALGGVLVSFCGRKKAMLGTLAMGVVATACFLVITQGDGPLLTFGIYGVLVLAMVGYGLNTTVVFTVIMDKSDPASASTDFSLQWSLSGLLSMAISAGALTLVDSVGYAGVLAGGIGVAVGTMVLVWFYDEFDSV